MTATRRLAAILATDVRRSAFQTWASQAGQIGKKVKEEHNADLIIMGSRGLGQVGGLILGSVSERVLHGAYGPVLIVR